MRPRALTLGFFYEEIQKIELSVDDNLEAVEERFYLLSSSWRIRLCFAPLCEKNSHFLHIFLIPYQYTACKITKYNQTIGVLIMNPPKTILIISLVLLTACSAEVNTPVAESTIPVVDASRMVASPSSVNEAGVTPAAAPPADIEPIVSEEQSVLSFFSQPVTAVGEPLILYGHLMDANGQPLSGYTVEIWQVDASGIYDHPGDSNTVRRDLGFQFYGTALTDKSGLFIFRTIVPARYEPRPRHIHFKVKQNGREILTSQFYFTGEVDATQLGSAGEMLLLDLVDRQDANGSAIKLANKDIVVDTGTGGSLTLTPSQTEGPYYPVVNVAQFDNDLASVQ